MKEGGFESWGGMVEYYVGGMVVEMAVVNGRTGLVWWECVESYGELVARS